LLRACAGLVPVAAGEATVLGCDLRHDPGAVRHRVGLLAHATGLYDDLTVAENVRFWGRAARAEPSDVDAAMALVGLDGRLRHVPASRLSAGQRRRAALACLLARRPELWLLDEPHAGLDHATRDELDRLVRQAVQQGATVLFSSHELDRATALADRVVELNAGTSRTMPERPSDPERRGAVETEADDTTKNAAAASTSAPAGQEVAGVA
jgi:ABC-type multidrug transport system ATPase subunit